MRTLLLLTLSAVTALQPQRTTEFADRDTAVYQAVVATIQFQLANLPPAAGQPTAGPVITLNRTLAMCGTVGSSVTRFGCLSDAEIIQPFEEAGSSFAERISKDRRQNLAAAFRKRNAGPFSFSGSNLAGLLVVAPEAIEKLPALESNRSRFFAAFSLPAFSNDGYALVYAAIAREGPGGAGWLCLLQQRGESWQVIKIERVWMG